MSDDRAPWPSGQSFLVGRAKDLDVIDSFLADGEHRGGALVLRGEPGVGKTALLDAVACRAPGRVLRVAGTQFEADLAFAGLNQRAVARA